MKRVVQYQREDLPFPRCASTCSQTETKMRMKTLTRTSLPRCTCAQTVRRKRERKYKFVRKRLCFRDVAVRCSGWSGWWTMLKDKRRNRDWGLWRSNEAWPSWSCCLIGYYRDQEQEDWRWEDEGTRMMMRHKDEDCDVPIRLGSLMLLSDQHLLSDKMRASSYQLW